MPSKHHGNVETPMRGGRLRETYGKTTSDYTGTAAQERGRKMGGSTDNLAHSLKGASAQQHVQGDED